MSPAAKAREAVNGRTTTSARTSSRARLIDRRGGPRYGPPASSSEGGYAPLGLPRPALGRAPAEPWRASGLTQDVSSRQEVRHEDDGAGEHGQRVIHDVTRLQPPQPRRPPDHRAAEAVDE